MGGGLNGELYDVARQYVARLTIVPQGAVLARLEQELGDDGQVVDAALRSFQGLAQRSNLPTLGELARLFAQGLASPYALPVLAGFMEAETGGADPLRGLTDDALRRALAFHLLSWSPVDPAWYLRLLGDRPQLSAGVYLVAHRARVRAKEPPTRHLSDLSAHPAYAKIAPLAVPRMFGVFPTSCVLAQVEALGLVLRAALLHMPTDDLAAVVEQRLERSGMDVAQRAHWLAAGTRIDPDRYAAATRRFLAAGRKQRARHLARALSDLRDRVR